MFANAFVTSPQTKRRIFFALWPSEQQRQHIESALAPYKTRLSGKWIDRENWHVTLVFIGNFPECELGALQEAAGRVACPTIELRFEQIEYWKRPKILCLKADIVPDRLTELVGRLASAARRFGYVPEKRPYKAHMTIARKARFSDAMSLAPALELHWSSFELVESVSTPAGVQYRPLKQ